MTSHVYVMQVPSGLVKIGVSKNTRSRMTQIQNGCPEQVKLIETCHGDVKFERLLHARYAKQRVRGEWFKLTNEQLMDLETELRIKSGFPNIDWSTARESMHCHWFVITDVLYRYKEARLQDVEMICESLIKRGLEESTISNLAHNCASYSHFKVVLGCFLLVERTGDEE